MYRILLVTCLLVVAGLLVALKMSWGRDRVDVVLANGEEIHELDPGRMSWMHDIRTAYGLWEGLLTMNPKTLAIEPAVASEYSVSPDGRTYTFTLRPEARWSNGDPVTAEDFRFAWMRVLDPATAADYYTYLLLIRGGEQYYNAFRAYYDAAGAAHKAGWPVTSTRPDPDSVAIRVIGPHRLEVELVRPVAYFPELIAFATFLPVHRASMEKFLVDRPGQLPYYDPNWLKPGNLVSNGPFVLTRWDMYDRIVLTRNEQYWDRAHVPSRRIALLANPDVNTSFLSYDSGQCDVLSNLPEAAGQALLAQHQQGRRPDLYVFPVWGTYYYRFNCKQPPFDDVRVRKALAMCIDREAIVRSITRRGERAQSSMVTPGLMVPLPPGWRAGPSSGPDSPDHGPGWRVSDDHKSLYYEPADGLPFDPAAARKLLADAGYGPGGKPFATKAGPVQLLLNDSPIHKPIAEAIAKMWQEHLGLKVELELQATGIFRTRLKEHTFDVARANWYTDYGDPTGFLEMFKRGDGNNDGQFESKRFDDLLVQSDNTVEPAHRFELIRQAERVLVAEECGVAPIYQYVGQFLYRRDIGGIWPNPKLQIMLKGVAKHR